jgi:hypothetical protein
MLENFECNEAKVSEIAKICRNIGQLLLKGLEGFYTIFNHILEGLFAAACVAEESTREFVLLCSRLSTASTTDLALPLINLCSDASKVLAEQQCKLAKKSQHKNLYER